MFYWVSWIILRSFLYIRCQYRITGLENVPQKGGAILLSNHRSYADPFVIGCAIKFRRTYFFAKEELFEIPIFNSIITSLGAFPVKRNTLDRKALNSSLNLLKKGKLLLIFGEGTRNRKRNVKLLPLRSGFAFLAIRAKVPVIPVYILGTEEVLSPKSLHPEVSVNFGKPIFGNNMKELTKNVDQALWSLS